MKTTTQEGRAPDGIAAPVGEQQTYLAIANVLLDQFQKPGLRVDHSVGVLGLRGLDLTIINRTLDVNLISSPVDVRDLQATVTLLSSCRFCP